MGVTEVPAEVPYGCETIITRKRLKPFTRRNDRVGLAYLTGHLTALGVTGYLVYLATGTAWLVPAIVVHGIIMAFLYAPLHECSHGTAFRTRWLNEGVHQVLCLIYVAAPIWYRYKHAAHHSYTQIRGDDAEVPGTDSDFVGPPDGRLRHYLLYVSAVPFWYRNIGNIVRHATGNIRPADAWYVPKDELPRVFLEARVLLAIYILVGVAAVAVGTWAPLIYWVIPRLVGEPAMRWTRVADHYGCEEVPDRLVNTRTIKSNPVVLALNWNMPFHAEHHLYPQVPFHRLPALHREIGSHFKEVWSGYFAVHRDVIRTLLARGSLSRSQPTG